MMSAMTERIYPVVMAVSLASAVPRLLHGPITWIATFRKRRAITDWLFEVSDRELADIGLSREQIRRMFDSAFAQVRNIPRWVGNNSHERMLADLGLNPTLPHPRVGG